MKLVVESPYTLNARMLLEELSQTLEQITGSSGRSSFNPEDVCGTRSLFVIAYDDLGQPMGCGGFRQVHDDIAEIKRLYAKQQARGAGSAILSFLEYKAKEMNYSTLWVETRLVNERAVAFYSKHEYIVIPNYGKYKNNQEAICFEKLL